MILTSATDEYLPRVLRFVAYREVLFRWFKIEIVRVVKAIKLSVIGLARDCCIQIHREVDLAMISTTVVNNILMTFSALQFFARLK